MTDKSKDKKQKGKISDQKSEISNREKVTEEIQEVVSKEEELTEMLQRVQADFVNYRNRIETEKKELIDYAESEVLLKIIPVLDNFNRAFNHMPKELGNNDWVSGVKQIEKQLEGILRDEGLQEIETVGKEFDHNLHEAVGFADGKGKFGEIVQELEKGYLLKDKVIRPAKVLVKR
ncbi:MAG: nucleotide exchange factor GrpE [Patescibacteria group bacterium]|nr:nucleotide exchange factor GrpE [Patescibacteria group bacterium]